MSSSNSMPVVEISEPGGPDVLVAGMRERPVAKAGHVVIASVAAGVNGPDIMQRKGLYPPPPGASDLLGLEVAGTIEAVGEGVSRWSVGDTVCALTNGGGYSSHVAVDARHCLPIPEGVALEDAAGLPETYFTVWSNLFMAPSRGENPHGLGAGMRLLVHGGAGGIGSTAIQLGKAFDATVIATESPEARCDFCHALGADIVINYRDDDFVAAVRDSGGADMILDIIGGANIEKNFKAASPDARIIQLAFNGGAKVEANLMPIMLKRLVLTGSTLRSRPDAFKAEIARQLEAYVWPKFADGTLRPVTSETFPLAQAAAAHSLMEGATHQGKILLMTR